MAKKSMIARDVKRAKTVEKFAAKRAALKTIIANVNAMQVQSVSVVAVRLLAVLTVYTVSSVCAVTSCVKQRCAVMCQAQLKLAGN